MVYAQPTVTSGFRAISPLAFRMARKRAHDGASASKAKSATTKRLCTVEGCTRTSDLKLPRCHKRHAFLAHGDRVEVENGDGGNTTKISLAEEVGAYEVLGRNVLKCEGERDGARCANPTASTSLYAKVRCEACAPGKS
jgi:hypothetical protein